MFFVLNASTVELLDVEAYVAETVGERPLVLWNLELDTLRADLGAPDQAPRALTQAMCLIWHSAPGDSRHRRTAHACTVACCCTLNDALCCSSQQQGHARTGAHVSHQRPSCTVLHCPKWV